MKCTTCNTSIPKGKQFCTNCGAPARKETMDPESNARQQAVKFCPQCGTRNIGKHTNCLRCQTPFETKPAGENPPNLPAKKSPSVSAARWVGVPAAAGLGLVCLWRAVEVITNAFPDEIFQTQALMGTATTLFAGGVLFFMGWQIWKGKMGWFSIAWRLVMLGGPLVYSIYNV